MLNGYIQRGIMAGKLNGAIPAHTKRNSVGVDIYSTSNTLGGFSHGEGGETACVLDNFIASEDVSLGVDDALSVLFGDHGGNVVLVLLEELLVLEHVADSL
jgi:hypothetical protein